MYNPIVNIDKQIEDLQRLKASYQSQPQNVQTQLDDVGKHVIELEAKVNELINIIKDAVIQRSEGSDNGNDEPRAKENGSGFFKKF